MITFDWGTATHAGNRRSRNEDSYCATANVFAVADGMGGHAAGDVASAIAVGELARALVEPALSRFEVLEAVRTADSLISTRSAEPEYTGMGTTVCGIACTESNGTDWRLTLFNVGDSRVYRLRDSKLEQLTRDHSVVQELIDSGELTEQESHRHPDRHVVTRSLGAGQALDIDWELIEPVVGDRFLLTSDGLTKEADNAKIEGLLAASSAPQAAADELLALALRSGGRDNITVVVVDVLAVSSEPGNDTRLNDDTNPRHAVTST